jgi:hypothetical protein
VHDFGLEADTLEEHAQRIIDVARMFEAYSCGDLDLAKAEEMAE